VKRSEIQLLGGVLLIRERKFWLLLFEESLFSNGYDPDLADSCDLPGANAPDKKGSQRDQNQTADNCARRRENSPYRDVSQ
jgi:hypothetical protein